MKTTTTTTKTNGATARKEKTAKQLDRARAELNARKEHEQELYNTAEKAVYIALRARHEKSGLKFLEELQNAQNIDRKCRTAPQISAEHAEHEKALEELRTEYTELLKLQAMADRQAVNIKLPQELRKAWAERERELTATIRQYQHRIKEEQATANELFKALSISFSDRADLTQTALLKLLELEKEPAPLTPSLLAVYGVEDAEELTDTERADAQARANFKAVINAVGKAISTVATPEALNRTTTKAEQITLEEVAEFIEKYGGIGKDIKAPHTTKRTRASDCYITVEERHTKTQSGFYRITHYKTVAPYQYIEDFSTAENGENDIEYLKSYNPFVSNSADLEQLEELASRCNLTDRQRLFLQAFASRCRYSADFKDCKNYAFKQIGITSDTNKSTFFNRLKKALTTK